jgi:hypothetical protein
MSFNEKALIHSRDNFTRETLNKRREKLGLTNLARIELFLWDLEIYLHIQRGLNKRIVLKGGTAAQFYLPVEQQRTSVDIDMICSASPKEIEELLESITNKFQGRDFLFRFRKHELKYVKPISHFLLITPLFLPYVLIKNYMEKTQVSRKLK